MAMEDRTAKWAPCLTRRGVEERKGCLTGDNGNTSTGGRLHVIQMHLISHCMRKGLVGEWHVLVY